MISLNYNTSFILSIIFCLFSNCSALTSCGPFSEQNSKFFLCDDGSPITSTGDIKFQLGFFTPKGNSNKNRYVGIWYLTDPETVVWIANRDRPLPESSTGSFGIQNDGDGNLLLLDEKGNSYFSSGLEHLPDNNLLTARLLEGGNLALSDERSGKILWQSFDNPTDTFLPGMKMTGGSFKLTSWKSSVDPSSGNYRFKEDEGVDQGYVVMQNDTIKYWKSGDQSKTIATNNKMHDMAGYLLNNSNPVRPNSTFLLNPDFNKTRLVISWLGEIQYFKLDSGQKFGVKIWWEPRTKCSVYNACGNFGNCRTNGIDQKTCDCLLGFKPAIPESWQSGDYSGGCSREKNLCVKEVSYAFTMWYVLNIEGAGYNGQEDEGTCKEKCLTGNCQCQAYSYRSEIGKTGGSSRNSCYIWTSELEDIQLAVSATAESHIFVKVVNFSIDASPPSPSEATSHAKKSLSRQAVTIVITCSVIAFVLFLCSLGYIYHRKMVAKRKEGRRDMLGDTVTGIHPRQLSEEDKRNIDVPFFDLKTVLAATNSFSVANMLGQGGFGPVYKGMFPGGQEIAVKRLSIHSMQGLEELKNEVMLIAKLQHRNLVRLLGYCIEGDENILLYEYMPNKSLDVFIFDQNLCMLLDWEKRFDIILGVARGLLYLHQDSRLRIIHRDLKASNILLDEDMIPKISDFGLARIVGGRDTAANTNRIVGTYGYMSPEYALEGLFSIKSDVFGFGVVVLEIISGKKNTGFYRSKHDLNLLGYAWRLWKEGNPLGIMEQTIVECCDEKEVLKCIIIGLLCVQEDPNDRPDMSNIVLMLANGDIENLPTPTRPAFVTRKNQQILSNNEIIPSHPHQQTLSNNQLTLSELKPR